jgi:hypothetical protein
MWGHAMRYYVVDISWSVNQTSVAGSGHSSFGRERSFGNGRCW